MKTPILNALILLICYLEVPEMRKSPPFLLPSIDEVKKELSLFTLTHSQLPLFSPQQKKLALLGEKFFFDRSFSNNETISCAHCHEPTKNFSNGLPVGMALGVGTRKVPSLLNAYHRDWLFWDGRADSLEAQALGPIENPLEHGISRVRALQVIYKHYKKEFESHFGPWSPILTKALLEEEAMPQLQAITPATKVSAYGLASLKDFFVMDSILMSAKRKNLSPIQELNQRSHVVTSPPPAWIKRWQQFSDEEQKNINKVFSQFGKAIATYERTIISKDSPFDLFAKKFLTLNEPNKAFHKDFGEKEFKGLQLFLGPGKCSHCHSGEMFTDEQFHNIGLSRLKDKTESIDMGRAIGALHVQKNLFNCLGDFFPEHKEKQSCQQLRFLDTENLEFVGAFKTPSLRNVALQAPYGHDGRFPSIRSVLDHYNTLDIKKGGEIGHIEETLFRLDFQEEELNALEAFLRSL